MGLHFLKAPNPMPWNKQHQQLLADVRQLKEDFEFYAKSGGRLADAYFDAADMTKFVLEKDETRTHNE